jgi:hypothetical protein
MKIGLGFALFASFAAPSLYGQAPPGPLPGGPPQDSPQNARATASRPLAKARDTILGPWRLNTEESEDARQKLRQMHGQNGSGGHGGGVRMGGGYPGHGGYGRPAPESEQDREKMRQLLEPRNSLAISMTGAEVDVIDDRDRKLALVTDGRKLQKSKDANDQQVAAKWEGKNLITDEKDPRGEKMSRRFELSPDGRQLFLTIHVPAGRSGASLVVRYVYDANDSSPSGR